MLSDFSYRLTIDTRWRDLDQMNHVNSAMYLTYFEIARMEYFDQVNLHDLKKPGVVGPAVVTQTCNYRQQLFHPSTLDVGIRCSRVGTKSFTVEYEMYLLDTDTLICDGSTTMAWVDYVNAKAIPIPDQLRAAIEAMEAQTA